MLERKIEFSQAFDKRHTDPKKNYGVHGVEIRWYLIGPKGAIQFVIYTNWQLAHVSEEQIRRAHTQDESWLRAIWMPMGADVGYHAREPQWEGQDSMDCHIIGGKCFYDGSSLRAHEWLQILIEKGGDEIWKMMEADYTNRFEPKEDK